MKKLLAACMLLIAATMHSQPAVSDSFKSVYAKQDISLTVDPRSAFWRGASPVFADLDTHGGVIPNHRTEVRSRWTKDNLYFLFVCPYEDLHLKPDPETDRETNQLWKWDVAEVFLGSDYEHIGRYKEFEVSPQGEWIDLDIDLSLPHHEDGWVWNSGFTVAATIDRKARVWYGAMRIPFSSITSQAPSAGATFRANLFRSQGPDDRKKNIAWKAPMTSTFHTPDRFGTLELTMKK